MDDILSADWITYTLRVILDGALLAEQTGLDWEDGASEFSRTESFYLNLPNPALASGTTIQLFRESDGRVEFELTIA